MLRVCFAYASRVACVVSCTRVRPLCSQRAGRSYIEDAERQALLADYDADARRCMLSLHEAAVAATRQQGNFEAAKLYLERSRDLRKHLGEPANVPQVAIAVFRLKLQRAKERDADSARAPGIAGSAQESWPDALVAVHHAARKFAEGAAVSGTRLRCEERCELRGLRAHVAWELASLGGRGVDSVVSLSDQAYKWLQSNVEEDGPSLGKEQRASMRLELADLCDRAMQKLADGGGGDNGEAAGRVEQLASMAIEQVLRAMADGSAEARDRLPSALALCRRLSPAACSTVSALLELPATWMALAWAPQLIAMLYEDHGVVIVPLLQRLATMYPQALYFPFQVSRGTLERSDAVMNDPARRGALETMGAVLQSEEIARLIAAFGDTLHPSLRMSDLLKELLALLEGGEGDAAAELYVAERHRWMEPRKHGRGGDDRGWLLVAFCKEHAEVLKEVCGGDGSKLRGNPRAALKALRAQLRQGKLNGDKMRSWVQTQTHESNRNELATYSAYLARYQRSEANASGRLAAIELPGQYAGDRPPQPETHVLIESIAPQLLLLSSLRMPKCLTLLGSDQREHHFLCKGGEDLRLDQRVQIMFGAMNRTLQAHAGAASRSLSMATYLVLPLSEQVGLIEWVGGTKTLRQLIIDEVAAREAAAATSGGGRGGGPKKTASGFPGVLDAAHCKYLAIYHPGDSARYAAMAKTAARPKLVEKFDEVRAGLPPDLLARAVAALSVSSEVYLSMRSTFARSLAALTACSHVLGIGDRHLDNFLLSLSSGRVVGIDFGMAFGAATYMLPVPEVMGVRLTRQLLSFLRPLDTGILLKAHMVHAVEALRARRADLMRLMEVFLSEPIVDWEAQTRRLNDEQRKRLESGGADAEEGTQPAHPPSGRLSVDGRSASPAVGSSNASAPSAVAASASRGGASCRGGVGDGTASGGSGGGGSLTGAWAAARLHIVNCKLSGGNSAALTLRDLATSVQAEVKKPELQRALGEIVLGPEGSLRRSLPELGLSAEQQVDVLIEQATDPNVLGRTWQGWWPWC